MNEVAFTPQILSIGPIHHGKLELKNTEEHKRRYLQDFLDLSNLNVEKYTCIVKDNELRLRDCYAQNIELNSDDFVKMMLVDASFVIMMLLKCSFQHLRSSNDRIFHRPWMETQVRYDMLLLENQIPFFILDNLYEASGLSDKLQGHSKSKLDIEFKNGILYFPTLKTTPGLEIMLRNLQAFEQCHCHDMYISDYIAFVTMLVKANKDVEIVARSGIIHNRLRSNERLATLFNDLAQEKLATRIRFHYSDTVDDMNLHCGSSWRKWKVTLEQDYFNTPWAGISVFAAFVLLMLTVIQAVCSVMQV